MKVIKEQRRDQTIESLFGSSLQERPINFRDGSRAQYRNSFIPTLRLFTWQHEKYSCTTLLYISLWISQGHDTDSELYVMAYKLGISVSAPQIPVVMR